MAFTRAQASELLNKSEMPLFDGSRANALRGLDRAALAGRVERTRAARDRARDLLKRQRLAARTRGEGKAEGIAARTARKEALLVEILQRFVEARRAAPVKVAKKAPAKKAAARKATVKKTAAKKTAAKKTPVKKAVAKKAVAKKAVAKKPAAQKPAPKKAVAKKAAAKTAAARKAPARKAASRRVSPQKALENTRSLLEAKHERDRTPQPWQSLDPVTDHVPQAGYQSPQAAGKAGELHAAEARLAPIHGSISTRDRRNQGKRDHRNDDSD